MCRCRGFGSGPRGWTPGLSRGFHGVNKVLIPTSEVLSPWLVGLRRRTACGVCARVCRPSERMGGQHVVSRSHRAIARARHQHQQHVGGHKPHCHVHKSEREIDIVALFIEFLRGRSAPGRGRFRGARGARLCVARGARAYVPDQSGCAILSAFSLCEPLCVLKGPTSSLVV